MEGEQGSVVEGSLPPRMDAAQPARMPAYRPGVVQRAKPPVVRPATGMARSLPMLPPPAEPPSSSPLLPRTLDGPPGAGDDGADPGSSEDLPTSTAASGPPPSSSMAAVPQPRPVERKAGIADAPVPLSQQVSSSWPQPQQPPPPPPPPPSSSSSSSLSSLSSSAMTAPAMDPAAGAAASVPVKFAFEPSRAEADVEGVNVVRRDGVLVACTLEKLIENITLPVRQDAELLDTFLLTFRSYTSPAEVVELLISRFHVAPPADAVDEPARSQWESDVLKPLRIRA